MAVELLQTAGRRIGAMLASVVNFFNPSLIVIGGGVAQSGDQLLAAIRESVYRRSLPLATRELVIQRSSLGGLGGVIGASAMVADQLFSRDQLPRWIEFGLPAGRPELGGAGGTVMADDGLGVDRSACAHRVAPAAATGGPTACRSSLLVIVVIGTIASRYFLIDFSDGVDASGGATSSPSSCSRR